MASGTRLGPRGLQYRIAQAQLLVYQQNFTEALKQYDEILNSDDVKEEERKDVLLKYVEAGVLALGAGVKSVNTDRLLAYAKKRVEMRDGGDWEAFYWLGMVYKSLEKKEVALKVLGLALNIDGSKECVRIARDELLLPEMDREFILPSCRESLDIGNMVTGMNLTPESVMHFAKMAKGMDDPNLIGLEDLVKGHMYRDGCNMAKDLGKAFTYYKKAADQGNPEAMYEVALMYLRGKGVEKNFKKAFETLHIVTEAPGLGNRPSGAAASANYTLGWLHLNGVGTPVNADVAYSFFKKSSDTGHASAAFMLGNMYSSGHGPVALDMEKAASSQY